MLCLLLRSFSRQPPAPHAAGSRQPSTANNGQQASHGSANLSSTVRRATQGTSTATTMATTRSKLGGVYPTALIHAKDREFHATLKQLRLLPSNRECAECQASPSTWASVSLGCFVCMNCAQVHRNLGAHISKVKSCMGTYLWCPDEIEQMKRLGNARVWRCYTGGATPAGRGGSGSTPPPPPRKPAADAPFEVRDAFARDKYERKRWMLAGGMEAVLAEESVDGRRAPSTLVAADADRGRQGSTAATVHTGGRNTAARNAARSRIRQMRSAQGQGGGAESTPPTPPPALVEPQEDRWDSWDAFGSWPSPTPTATPPPAQQQQQQQQQRTVSAPVDDFFAQFGLAEPLPPPPSTMPSAAAALLAPPPPPVVVAAARHRAAGAVAAAVAARTMQPCRRSAAESTDLINLFSGAATATAVPQR
jgi:hypothetical protein